MRVISIGVNVDEAGVLRLDRISPGGGPDVNLELANVGQGAKIELGSCTSYRAWLNDTGEDKDRTVSAHRADGVRFPASSKVTIFVADDKHAGAPKQEHKATTLDWNGGSVGKRVPKGKAVFVHYDKADSDTQIIQAWIGEHA